MSTPNTPLRAPGLADAAGVPAAYKPSLHGVGQPAQAAARLWLDSNSTAPAGPLWRASRLR